MVRQKQEIKKFNTRQSYIVEQKDELLDNIIRIVGYFWKNNHSSSWFLDIGTGQGILADRLLQTCNRSYIVGVDVSPEKLREAAARLIDYGPRFRPYVTDFNTDNFWKLEMKKQYSCAVSSMALHYLDDRRLIPFFKGLYHRLTPQGFFVAGIACLSSSQPIAKMQKRFKLEYAYGNTEQEDSPSAFEKFEKEQKLRLDKMGIKWRSVKTYTYALCQAGFQHIGVVWRDWTKAIVLALK